MCANRHVTLLGKTAFTLVEVIVAITLLGISMIAVLGTFRACAGVARHARLLTQSVCLAERLLVEADLRENAVYGLVKGNEGRYAWDVRIAPTSLENLGAISVQVSWWEQGRAQQYELLSFRRMPSLVQRND